MMYQNDPADSWVDTDPEACRQDIERLGLEEAARYNTALAAERAADGDDRWDGITVEAMRSALERLVSQAAE